MMKKKNPSTTTTTQTTSPTMMAMVSGLSCSFLRRAIHIQPQYLVREMRVRALCMLMQRAAEGARFAAAA